MTILEWIAIGYIILITIMYMTHLYRVTRRVEQLHEEVKKLRSSHILMGRFVYPDLDDTEF